MATDPRPEDRQAGVVDDQGRTAAWTESRTIPGLATDPAGTSAPRAAASPGRRCWNMSSRACSRRKVSVWLKGDRFIFPTLNVRFWAVSSHSQMSLWTVSSN